MTQKKFKLFNWVACAIVTIISAVTYLMTMESSASFWDCGEFIASSYKLEVGHPPGNPTFQLLARIFSMAFGAENAAVAVNALSAMCSAFTIFFLYLTIVFFAKRVVKLKDEESFEIRPSAAVAVIGSGVLGALAYAFSDTFWFSAVEAEVYAMSSLFTATVLWAMTKWYENADKPHANRWIVLIAFLMGLSIGVHLLNLLMIPALVFLYYFKKKEDGTYTFWQCCGIFLIGVVILGVLNFIVIPYLPKLAAYFDLFFVNVLGLPFNSGAVFFVILLFVLGFVGAFQTLKKKKALANTIIVCGLAILAGYSLFSICVIRSCAKTPTNEYQPDNPFTLVRYLSREQYGTTPLLYGQYYDCPMETTEETEYRTPLDGKYVLTEGQPDVVYSKSGKMFFPRMHSSSPEHIKFYEQYVTGGGKQVKGAKHPMPSFGDNLAFFFDFQLNWMYWRYFMWNFAGRQNEIHAPSPGNLLHGNWESGIAFLDSIRLGDQSSVPDDLKNNKGKNHYYLLPLLLGLLGLCFQCSRDHRGCWINFLVFFMTGIAIVIYLNQPPMQVRERDYAYAGSFYAFSLWIGLALAAIYEMVERMRSSEKAKTAVISALALLCLGVPTLMASENWDDHNRHNRRTAVEIAYNYLNSVGPNGILITHGDNDTFPVWYAQEVEGIRTDVRLCNTSLLGTDWHIDQMKYACNESAPLKLQVPLKQYLYGTNEFVYIVDSRETVIPIADVMRVFRHPDAKVQLERGKKVDYIMSRKISVPVNKENVLKYGILSEEFADKIPSEIILTIPKGKNYITKPELFMLDLLSGYEWDRPLNLLGMGGDINIGIKEYLMYEGFSYKFVPIKTGCKRADPGIVDVNELDNLFNKVYKWDAISADNWTVDYQNIYTFCGVVNYREMFAGMASIYNKAGRHEDAVKILDKCREVMKESNFPLVMPTLHVGNELAVYSMIEQYYKAGAKEKAHDLAKQFSESMLDYLDFYIYFSSYSPSLSKSGAETIASYLYYLCDDLLDKNGDKELSQEIQKSMEEIAG